MWFLLLNISSSFARLSLFYVDFFSLFIYLLGRPSWSKLPQGEPTAFFLKRRLHALLNVKKMASIEGIRFWKPDLCKADS